MEAGADITTASNVLNQKPSAECVGRERSRERDDKRMYFAEQKSFSYEVNDYFLYEPTVKLAPPAGQMRDYLDAKEIEDMIVDHNGDRMLSQTFDTNDEKLDVNNAARGYQNKFQVERVKKRKSFAEQKSFSYDPATNSRRTDHQVILTIARNGFNPKGCPATDQLARGDACSRPISRDVRLSSDSRANPSRISSISPHDHVPGGGSLNRDAGNSRGTNSEMSSDKHKLDTKFQSRAHEQHRKVARSPPEDNKPALSETQHKRQSQAHVDPHSLTFRSTSEQNTNNRRPPGSSIVTAGWQHHGDYSPIQNLRSKPALRSKPDPSWDQNKKTYHVHQTEVTTKLVYDNRTKSEPKQSLERLQPSSGEQRYLSCMEQEDRTSRERNGPRSPQCLPKHLPEEQQSPRNVNKNENFHFPRNETQFSIEKDVELSNYLDAPSCNTNTSPINSVAVKSRRERTRVIGCGEQSASSHHGASLTPRSSRSPSRSPGPPLTRSQIHELVQKSNMCKLAAASFAISMIGRDEDEGRIVSDGVVKWRRKSSLTGNIIAKNAAAWQEWRTNIIKAQPPNVVVKAHKEEGSATGDGHAEERRGGDKRDLFAHQKSFSYDIATAACLISGRVGDNVGDGGDDRSTRRVLERGETMTAKEKRSFLMKSKKSYSLDEYVQMQQQEHDASKRQQNPVQSRQASPLVITADPQGTNVNVHHQNIAADSNTAAMPDRPTLGSGVSMNAQVMNKKLLQLHNMKAIHDKDVVNSSGEPDETDYENTGTTEKKKSSKLPVSKFFKKLRRNKTQS